MWAEVYRLEPAVAAALDTRRRRRAFIVVGALVWATVGLIWLLRKPADLGYAAMDAMLAAESSDGHRLMKYAFPLEVEVNKLTPVKLERLFKEVINPCYAEFRATGTVEVENLGHQGFAKKQLSKPGRSDVALGANSYMVDGRPRVPLTSHLMVAWAQTMVDKSAWRSMPGGFLRARNEAVLQGLRRDRAKLSEIGIVAIVDIDPIGGQQQVIRLDELENRYTAWNQQLMRQQQTGR